MSDKNLFLLLGGVRNPNGEKLPYWPRFDKDEKYLQLDFDTRVGVKLKEKKMAFWSQLRQSQKP
jgi:hypothetical protein